MSIRQFSPRSVFTLLLVAFLGATAAEAEYEAVELVSGLSAPLYVCSPADDERLFIVEQSGRIKILENGQLLGTPFLSLAGQISFGGERGLLGLAFHPQYADNGYFYVNFNPLNADCAEPGACSVIARFTVSAGDPNLAAPASRVDLLELRQPYNNHNGGMLMFGPDGYLYAAFGDGGSAGDPFNNAQNKESLLGKMLRLDVDGAAPYGIPPDNPFVGESGRDEIWAYGLRNPWRASFDRLTGDMWIGDVGQYDWEEVDFQPASSTGGENYGWRLMEGTHCFNPPVNCDDGSLVHPVIEYARSGGRCSVIGGYVYRRPDIPELNGLYIYGDYCTADVWAFDPADSSVTSILTSQSFGSITSFGEDAAGRLHIVGAGRVWRLVGDTTDLPAAHGDAGFITIDAAYPNPFQSRISLSIGVRAARSELSVAVFSVAGRRLRDLHQGSAPAGKLDLRWDGRDDSGRAMPGGVYFIRADDGLRSAAERVTLLR